MKEEVQTCPDRNGMPGPWDTGENLDRWRTDRWSKLVVLVKLQHLIEKWLDILKHGKQTLFLGDHNDEWLWPGPVPRTCSFCGGIHPEDAIRLVSEGWEVETTGKTYKRYLEPPGYKARMARLLAMTAQRIPPAERPKQEDHWSPVPPVKVYVIHFNRDQVERFNKLLPPKPTYQ